METTEGLSTYPGVAEEQTSASLNKQPILHEDWVVVLLGFVIIGIALFGFILPVPAFGWKTAEELGSKVMSVKNVSIIGLQFLFILVVAMLGALLTGKPLRSFLVVFPVVYFL